MKMKKIISSIIAASLAFSSMSAFAAGDANQETGVVKMGDEYYSSLTCALDDVTAEGEVKIELLADAELDYDAREAYGVEGTTSIKIIGNNNTLTLNQKDSDWSSIGMKNADGVFVLENLNVVKAAHEGNGAWNNHAINFTCDVNFNNVDFDNSVALEADGVLTNVEIKDNKGDYYGLIITAEGQSVEMTGGSIVAGRGIKVMDQYVDNPAKVEIEVSEVEFKTSKKAAILVTSTAGADITVDNINISKCAADSENAVWVDSDRHASQALVTVTGGSKVYEDQVAEIDGIGYASFKDAAAAAKDGDVVELADGTYDMVSIGKDVTIKGSRNVVIGPIGAYGTHASLTFDGITLKFTNDNYKGFQHSDVMTYNNVKIVGQPFLYGNVETFNNCEFVQESANAYNVWTYSAKNVTFNGCTFKSAGKSVLIYNEGSGDTTVDVVDCELSATAPVEGKAAFEIHTKGGACYLTIDEETSATGFATGSVSGNSLWNDKSTEKTDALNDVIVKVDDEVVLARTEDATKDVAAIVDNELFDSLSNAVKALKNDSTMIILEGEYTGDFGISGMSGVTVKGQGNVVINGKPSFGNDFDVSGIKFVYPGKSGYIGGYGIITNCEFTGSNGFRYCYSTAGETVTFKNSVITGSTYGIHFDGNGGQIIIDNCTITGWTSFASTIEKVTIIGSKFAEGNYNVLRFYQDAEISNTEFNPNSRIDAGNGGTGMTGIEIKVDNCTVSNGSDVMDRIPSSVISASDVKIDGEIVGKIATVIDTEGNESYYETLADAVAAAQDGDTIDLMGNTAEFPQANIGKALTIANGTITLPSALTRAATEPTYWFVSNDITFENITFTGENYNTAGWGVFYLTKTGASVNFVNSTVNLKNDISSGGGFIKGDVTGVTASFDNTDVYLENTKRGFNNLASLTLSNDSDFVLKGTTQDGMENAINKAGLVAINDTSSIEIDGCFEYGIKMDNSVYVNDKAKVVVRNSGIADIMERENAGNPGLRVNDDAIVIADIITPEVWVITQGNGEVIEKSENIYVQFKKVDIDADNKDTVEGSDKYEIILSGYNHNINRLTTADLTFKLDAAPYANADMAYAIEPRAGITLTPHDADGYMFNFNGVTAPDETGENIVIGYVTISGYGNYSFSVAADNIEKGIKNIVNATEVQDSIVDTFVIGGATDKGTLIINTTIDNDIDMVGEIKDIKIAVPTRTLKITIDFPNAIEDNANAYQDMKVEIAGNIDGINQTVKYMLGTGSDAVAMNDGDYVVTESRLVLNESYTVTVSGAGYRTARYTVRMTDNKELKFWNNVMDEYQFVEIGEKSSEAKVTFLAGDIVKDNKINIYDLSAVVSYFGQTNDRTAYSNYAKYDLNRDGLIDSKDVAYVLVSWDN